MSGNGDLKNQDDKDSDGAEASSPTSQGQYPLGDREEEEKGDAQSVQSLDDENKSAGQISDDLKGTHEVEGEGAVEIVREFKSEEVSESQNVSIEYVESTKVSGHGGSSGDSGSSSSSSSSDDESQVTNECSKDEGLGKLEEIYSSVSEFAPAEEVPCDTKSDPVVETVSFVVSVKPEVSSSEVVNLVSESDVPEDATSDAKGVLVEEDYKPIVEITSVVDLVKPEVCVSGEKTCVTDSSSLGYSVVDEVVELGLKENEEEKLTSSTESPDVSAVMVDSSSKKTEDEVFPLPDGDAGVFSTVAGSEVLENDDEPLPSSDAPNFETSNGAEHVQNSVVAECSEKQVLPLKFSYLVLVFVLLLGFALTVKNILCFG